MIFSRPIRIGGKERNAGFTLAELMVTIGLLAILAGIAVPGFIRWIPNYRLRSAARDLLSSFQLAKVAAIKSGWNGAVTFNQPVDGVTYGYVVFEDADDDLEYDSTEKVIRKVEWSGYEGVTVTDNTLTLNNDNLPAIAFRSNGIPRNNAGGFGAGTVTLTNPNGRTTKVIVSAAGNIRIE